MRTLRHWLAHVMASLLDSFAAVTGFYYSKKYAAIVKRLGLRPAATYTEQPGLIIVQIDGLAHEHLLQALDKGSLPHVKRMWNKDGFTLAPWHCGLPSTTPASQAGIMFGNNDDIPAFRWYDKAHGTSWVCKLPGIAALVQSRVSRGRTGILKGGTSYVNLFDGGASDSLFTLSDLQPRRFFEGVRGLGFVTLFLLNPVRALRTVYLALKEAIADALQRFSLRLHGQSYLPFIGIFPLLRAFSNVISREIETFAVLVDIYRGVPAIYANYYGYDEIAHHFGVDSLAARQALRDLDGRLGQINRLRRANLSRPYVLCFLSDHGMTSSEPFEHRYGESLGQAIQRLLGESVLLVEHADGEQQSLSQTRFLLGELRTIEGNLRPTAARVARHIRRLVQRRLAQNPSEPPDWNLRRQFDVVVKSSGSLAHVYCNITPRRMDLSEVTAAFPGLVLRLLEHGGIGLVVAREGEQTLILGSDGILTLDGQGRPILEGENPLRHLKDPWEAAEQIQRVASFPSSGDLMLLGDYDPQRGVVVCFENQWASHGGLGGPQDEPFILYPAELGWDLSGVHNSRDLYPFFARQREGSYAKDTKGTDPPIFPP